MMLLRSLSLRNIRSYNDGEETRLDFPEGVTLFEGDIGSGKSTLLYALEFALFGLSDMKGTHLLSEGRKDGLVSLAFESGGTEYLVERRLKVRGDDVVQGECHISSGGEKERLSPSDLKERIISILGFNEPTHPRAESLVYRYAVFTPQEQMKEILTQNSDERLHVIRRVLGAQSYQVAADNSDIVERRIKEMGYGLKKEASDLEEKKDELDEKSRTMAELESEIPKLRETEAASSKLVDSLESRWREALEEQKGLAMSEAKAPLLRQELARLKAVNQTDEERLGALESQLANEIEPKIKEFESLRPAGDLHALEEEADKAKEGLVRLKESKRSLEAELEKSRNLIARGICPLCGQPISGDMSAKSQHSEKELSKLGVEITDAEKTVASLLARVEDSRSYNEAQKERLRAEADRDRVAEEVVSLRKRLHEAAIITSRLSAELTESESKAKALHEATAVVDELESKLKRARRQEKDSSKELTRATAELEAVTRELELLSKEVTRKEAALAEAQRLVSYQGWLSTFFKPTVELIEKQTLSQAAARFNEHFQRFFNSLVDDPDMIVRVKEDFSPLFEREGFEQDYEALSGGERTSMALAYRFALNVVVRESVSTRPELVILDEPTDGFSKEQVYKMRGLLEELASKQVVMVSHERELESMADHIFRVEKRNGTSVVSNVHLEG